ncbi:unnamed protein product [Auanema sp. JU1783]|nr:unnamed protein product [Auanema sp. JU1783]
MSNAQKIKDCIISVENALITYQKSLIHIQNEIGDIIEQQTKEKHAKAREKADLKKLDAMNSKELMDGIRRCMEENKNASFKYLIKCYKYWNTQLMPAIKKIGISTFCKLQVDICGMLCKLSGYLFLHGDYYKGLECLYDMVSIYPDFAEGRTVLIRWCVTLGEWELLEDLLVLEKKLQAKAKSTSGVGEIKRATTLELSKLFLDFIRKEPSRDKICKELLHHHMESVERVSTNTYTVSEYFAVTHYMCSFLSRVPNFNENVPDPLHLLQSSYAKFETIMRNRIPGIARENFRIDVHKLFEDPKKGFEAFSSIADCLEVLRELIIEFYNCGMLKEAYAFALLGLQYANKLGIFFRIQQFHNLILMIQSSSRGKDISETSSVVLLNTATLYSASKASRCHTPLLNCLPSPRMKTSWNSSSMAGKLMLDFQDLKLNETSDEPTKLKSLHKIDKKCECETCIHYANNYNSAMEYQISNFYYELNSTQKISDGIEKLVDAFSVIRERMIDEQAKLIRKKGRPRPPISMCESVLLSSVHWLRHLEGNGRPHLRDNKLSSLRSSILQTATKIANYSSIKYIGYSLALRHFDRMDKLLPSSTSPYSWMSPSSEAQRKGRVCQGLISLFRSFVNEPGDIVEPASNVIPFLIAKKSELLTKLLAEAQKDYYDYNHLLYRHWRFPVTTFIAAHTDSKFRSAMLFSESTVLGSRATARMLSKKITGVTFSNSTVFEGAVKRLPIDFTVIQLALDSDGNLFLIKLHAERTPFVIPVAHYTKVFKSQSKMSLIMEANEKTSTEFDSANKNRAKNFWSYRRKVDQQLESTVAGIQNYLFQRFLPMLLPCQSLAPRGRELAAELLSNLPIPNPHFDLNWSEELISLVFQVTRQQWCMLIDSVGELCELSESSMNYLKNEYLRLKKSLCGMGMINKSKPLYTFLIVPPVLGSFPFEVMPIYNNRPHVGRLVSLHALLMLLRKTSKLPQPVVVSNSYYVLDPDNNLDNTQVRISNFISKHAWTGVVGNAPSMAEFQNILENKDMFFYFGHGSGSKHFNRRSIQESQCRAVAILMGCGSVAMEYEGWGLDGKCTAYHYAIAKCPAVLGCLWMVTDGEIDRYFMALIDLVFSSDANTTVDEGAPRLRVLLDGMQKARQRVKLPFLTGASVVSFGLPIVSSE